MNATNQTLTHHDPDEPPLLVSTNGGFGEQYLSLESIEAPFAQPSIGNQFG